MCTCVRAHTPQCICRGQRTMCRSLLSLSSIWGLEIQVSLFGFAAGCPPAEPSLQPCSGIWFFKKTNAYSFKYIIFIYESILYNINKWTLWNINNFQEFYTVCSDCILPASPNSFQTHALSSSPSFYTLPPSRPTCAVQIFLNVWPSTGAWNLSGIHA